MQKDGLIQARIESFESKGGLLAIDGSIARVKGAVKSEWLKVVKVEERSNLLRDLIREGKRA